MKVFLGGLLGGGLVMAAIAMMTKREMESSEGTEIAAMMVRLERDAQAEAQRLADAEVSRYLVQQFGLTPNRLAKISLLSSRIESLWPF